MEKDIKDYIQDQQFKTVIHVKRNTGSTFPIWDDIILTIPRHASGDDWKEAFRSVLFWATFTEDVIDDIFNEEEEE
jgi:hypothetical protein